jgi:hypothetical protein
VCFILFRLDWCESEAELLKNAQEYLILTMNASSFEYQKHESVRLSEGLQIVTNM